MREEIIKSIERMSYDDLMDVKCTLELSPATTRSELKKLAFKDEAVAEYVLMY